MLGMPLTSIVAAFILAFSSGVVYVLRLYRDYRKAVDLIHLPGYRTFFSVSSIAANIRDSATYLALGRHNLWVNKHKIYKDVGWDIHSAVSIWPTVNTVLFLADASSIKEVCSSRFRFPKPVHQYSALKFFGSNIIASEGDEWRKYRKVVAPAFSDRNNRLVWDESIKVVQDMFETVWENKEKVVVDDCLDVTLPIALHVISSAGFGRRISWGDDLILPPGHQLTFKDAIHTVSVNVILKLIIPDWAPGITKRLRRVHLAFHELKRYMSEMIETRKTSEKKDQQFDLFTSLLNANEGNETKLTESELIGNIFFFLLAGHETTAHTLCYTFAMLALHQDEQETLYQHIRSVHPDGRLPTYEEMPLFTRSMAVFYETLRMFPPVTGIPKYSAEDTVIVAGNAAGDTRSIPVPKGTDIIIHTVGLHYNPRYWEDPHRFKPARFLEDWPREAFLPFSSGARACLGRRFFETEGVAVLTLLALRYKIKVKEEPQFAGETFEEMSARLVDSKYGMTLTPVRVPLTFIPRTG